MNALINYIQTHENWREELSEAPFHLSIKEDGPYTIFNYNQIKSDFSLPEVQVARGIILKIDEGWSEKEEFEVLERTLCDVKVVCFPFSKFFNYGEPNAHSIDWASAKVQEKVDGSILKVWYDGGMWHTSTNGVINAFQCDLQMPTEEFKSFGDLYMKAVWNQGLIHLDMNLYFDHNSTHVFELTSPWNRVVVPYKDIKLTYLGSRNNETGEEYVIESQPFDRPKMYSFGTFEEAVENAAALPFSQEGYVVVDKDWHRVKIKGLQYLLCHRLKGESFSNKRAIELALMGEESEFLSYFPEYKPIVDRAFSAINSIRNYLSEKIADADSREFNSQKDFALYVKDWKFSGFFFGRRSGKVKDVETYIRDLDYKEIEKRMY